MTKQLKIGIAGAGIGGLAAGALLAQQGHDVKVFDQFDTPAPVGSGLVIQPVGQAVLDALGAGDAARQKGNPIRRMLGHEATSGRRVLDVWYDPKGNGDRFGLAIHRASLFEAILSVALHANIDLVSGHRVVRADTGQITFDDGKTARPFDLVIDACGAASPLSPMRARPLPYGAIWGTVPWPEATDLPQTHLSQIYRRADRMVGVLPIGTLPGETTQQTAIFWSLPADDHDAWKTQSIEAWKDEAIDLWPAIEPFLGTVTQHDQMTMARYAHGTLRKPYADRLAVIGDAAHKASPQLGQGANMALLDAMALSEALKNDPVDTALARYGQARRWHVRTYQAMSWAFTPQYQSDSRWLPILRDRVIFPASQIPPVPRLLTRLVCGDMLPPLASLTPGSPKRALTPQRSTCSHTLEITTDPSPTADATRLTELARTSPTAKMPGVDVS